MTDLESIYVNEGPSAISCGFTDYCLKFDSEAQAKSLLFPNASEENGLGFSPFGSVDLIGTLYDKNQVAIAGYHVNVRATSAFPELDAYRVYPVTPSRVWA
ncbi:MAG: hypothetical protein EBU90_21705 [Proteobacteria bacterium]|nr:hypothetical protein [Pseudomonadota bacterium]